MIASKFVSLIFFQIPARFFFVCMYYWTVPSSMNQNRADKKESQMITGPRRQKLNSIARIEAQEAVKFTSIDFLYLKSQVNITKPTAPKLIAKIIMANLLEK